MRARKQSLLNNDINTCQNCCLSECCCISTEVNLTCFSKRIHGITDNWTYFSKNNSLALLIYHLSRFLTLSFNFLLCGQPGQLLLSMRARVRAWSPPGLLRRRTAKFLLQRDSERSLRQSGAAPDDAARLLLRTWSRLARR